MNNKLKKFGKSLTGKNGVKNLVISIVILVELIAILGVATYAWVETVSSIKITTESTKELEVDTYVFTEATIGGTSGTVNLGKYFKQAGDMHFSPASSADGVNMFFPKVQSDGTAYISSGSNRYRKGNTSDMNTAYLSVSFKLKASTNADFFFEQVPSFTNQSANMRVSVTAYTEGLSDGDLYDNTGKPLYTKIYASSASSDAVVNNVNGSTGTTSVEAFSDHIKGTGSSNRLFAVGANETKIVTINVWLQGTTMDGDLPQSISISNFGITSSLTPRHVTLLPTPTWDTGAQTYYAWCWTPNSGKKSRLYKLELNPEEEHYTFDYDGTYTKTTFIRAVPGCTVQPGEYDSWPFTLSTNSNDHDNAKYWKQTEDTSIPNDPIDPTYIIETINGGTDSKSTGSWHDPATIKVALCTECFTNDTPWGSVGATSYIGSNTSSHVIETTNSSSQKHKDTVHAWPGKILSLNATVANASNYAFVGWYTDAAGTTPAPKVNGTAYTAATYTPNAPATASEVTYYAKFKEVHTVTLQKVVDNSDNNTSGVGGSLIIDNVTYNTSPKSITKDKNVAIPVSGSAASGYTYLGVFSNRTGGAEVTQLNANASSTTYYARFTTNSYRVTAHAYYSTDGGSTYTADDSTGGTVQVTYNNSSATAGATSYKDVKYKASCTLTAAPASGYEFDGWYNSSGNLIATDATSTNYSYTLNTADNVNVYGRFVVKTQSTTIYVSPRADWGDNYYVRLYQTGGTNVVSSNNGFVKADYDSNTGYYKATFTTTKTGTFWALIAKDTNHTDKVPSDGGYTGTLGTNYIFKHDQSASELTQYSSQRCIWFIDGTTNHWIGNNSAKMRIDNWSNTYDMRYIGSYCYVYEYTTGTDFSNASGITFKRTKSDNTQLNYWNTAPQTDKSQYTADQTGNNHGWWSN